MPGKPEESLLIQAIQRQDDVSAMPPEKDESPAGRSGRRLCRLDQGGRGLAREDREVRGREALGL